MSDAIFPATFVSSTLLAQKANSCSRAHYNTRKTINSSEHFVLQVSSAKWIMSNYLFGIMHHVPIKSLYGKQGKMYNCEPKKAGENVLGLRIPL